jgi:hypothetical protein
MTVVPGFDPIFVHASARSGSTYVFGVLRRNEHLMCFNEAIIDGKTDYANLASERNSHSDAPQKQKWDVNHHFLDRSDEQEFLDAWDEVMHLCPDFPTFQDYLPPAGVLQADLVTYLSGLMDYAHSRDKRPVLCEINSRGRAGALRGVFGGYHVAQYRNPISQFGSFIRALIDGGTWGFLSHPVTELGVNSDHPLCRVVPEQWRAPHFPWRTDTRARRWGSDARYIAATASADPESVERLFRWHMFAWLLNNVAALSYSDLSLDVDKLHDDTEYRASVVAALASRIGEAPDFRDIQKFDRYYEFESFDTVEVCDQVTSAIKVAVNDGRLDAAVRTLGTPPPVMPTATAAELMLEKIRESLVSVKSSHGRRRISAAEWKDLAAKNRKIWHASGVRWVAERIYPLAAPVGRMARRAGIPI